jgi:hypothetical protein
MGALLMCLFKDFFFWPKKKKKEASVMSIASTSVLFLIHTPTLTSDISKLIWHSTKFAQSRRSGGGLGTIVWRRNNTEDDEQFLLIVVFLLFYININT